MAMNKTGMADLIIAKVQAASPKYNSDDVNALKPFLEAFCDGVIEHIQNNMEIETEVQVIGVQAGPDTIVATGEDTSIS